MTKIKLLYSNILSMVKKYIKRKRYLHRIKPFIDKDIIKVIVGQ